MSCIVSQAPQWRRQFLVMLPTIRHHAHIAFHDLGPEAQQDAIQKVVGHAWMAFSRLAALGKADIAYPLPLAKYAIRQHQGRCRLGSRPPAAHSSARTVPDLGGRPDGTEGGQ